jgi:hypothetical protein
MTRCEQCRKKLGVLEYKCKCGKIFCITHLHAEEHNCNYNYKEEGKELLKKINEVGPLTTKLDKI